MHEAAAVHEFEQAAIERNRLQAVRALLERQRVANASVGSVDAVGGRGFRHGRERAGVPGARRGALGPAVLLPRERGENCYEAAVLEEFLLQFYTSAPFIPPQVLVGTHGSG